MVAKTNGSGAFRVVAILMIMGMLVPSTDATMDDGDKKQKANERVYRILYNLLKNGARIPGNLVDAARLKVKTYLGFTATEWVEPVFGACVFLNRNYKWRPKTWIHQFSSC